MNDFERSPLPANPSAAAYTVLLMTVRLSKLVAWLGFALLHLALLTAWLALAWWNHWSPEAIAAMGAQILQSRISEALGLFGVSALSVYALLLRALYRSTGRLIASHLTEP